VGKARTVGGILVAVAAMAAGIHAQNLTPWAVASVQERLLAAADPAIAMTLWSTRRDSPPAGYVRNPRVWTGPSVDLTGKAVWNSWTGSYGTTAISPRHVVYAEHVNGLYPAGTIVRFVAGDNSVVERIVAASVRIGATDLDISTLDDPLPGTIHWFRIMPRHWFLHCARTVPGIEGAMPCLVMDGNTQSVSVKDLAGFSEGVFLTTAPVDARRRQFTRNLRLGDSGSPMFILLGGEAVLDGLYHTAQGGVEVGSYARELDAAMAGSGFQATIADFSGVTPP